MAAEDKDTLLGCLERGESALKTALSAVPQEILKLKPTHGSWSALECVEHVVLMEQIFCKRIENSPILPNDQVNKEREASISMSASSREPKISAAPEMQPQAIYSNAAEALDAMLVSNTRVNSLVSERAQDLRRIQVTHPKLGKLTAYESLLVVAAHRHRHAHQIHDIQKQLETAVVAETRG